MSEQTGTLLSTPTPAPIPTTSATPAPIISPSTPEIKPAETPKAEAPKAETPAAFKLTDLKLPEGATLDEPIANKFAEILNGDKLSVNDRAQALYDLHNQIQKDASEKGSKLWEETQAKWQDEVKADPEVGGEKLGPTLANIAKLVDKFGTKELREVFDLTGVGNNPHAIKFLDKIAKQLVVEGAAVPAAAPGNDSRSRAEILFPTQGKAA